MSWTCEKGRGGVMGEARVGGDTMREGLGKSGVIV